MYSIENKKKWAMLPDILKWATENLRTVWIMLEFKFHLSICNTVEIFNKGNAKRGVSPRLKIRPSDLDLWPWKSIGFQILLRSKYVPSLTKIHWRMLILVFTRMLRSKNLTQWHWPLTLKIKSSRLS